MFITNLRELFHLVLAALVKMLEFMRDSRGITR